MARWTASGLSAGEFARKHDLSEGSLRWWKWQLGSRRRKSGARAPRAQRAPAVSPLTFVEMTSVSRSEPVEIVLVSGTRIRLPADFDVATIERLLEVLDRRR